MKSHNFLTRLNSSDGMKEISIKTPMCLCILTLKLRCYQGGGLNNYKILCCAAFLDKNHLQQSSAPKPTQQMHFLHEARKNKTRKVAWLADHTFTFWKKDYSENLHGNFKVSAINNLKSTMDEKRLKFLPIIVFSQ